MVNTALKARDAGLSCLPIKRGSKVSRVAWKEFQDRIAEEAEIRTMFHAEDWFAVITGKVSGNLELIDFDIPDKVEGEKGTPPAWAPFQEFMLEHGFEDLLAKLVTIETRSGGIHLVYRCAEGVAGNQQLAMNQDDKVLIETRGEGGYFLTWPTPGYKAIHGSFNTIPDLSADDRELLLNACRVFTEVREEYRPERANPHTRMPGEDYNARATWHDLLTPHGWVMAGKSTGGRVAWVRPGKSKKDGISATTGNGPTDLFYVHSTNASPFESGKSYSKFAAYAILNCNKDFHFAAQELKSKGFGKRDSAPSPVTKTEVPRAKVPAPNALDELEGFGDDFTPVEVSFLWDPYLPIGKCVLLDADGGTGKSSLAIGLAAMFSNGIMPITGEVCEPFKTLYLHRGEDRSDELETVYRACGGKPGMIRYYRKHDLYFDQEGLDRVHNWIEAGKFRLVVADALFYFLPPRIENTNDNIIAQRVVQSLNDVAESTNSTFLNQRHTTKGSVGKAASDLGMGSVAFRNSHRGQLVARFHPDQRGVIIVEDLKGSILVERGEHFAYRRVGHSIEFIRNLRNPFDDTKEQPVTAHEKAEDFIRQFAGAQEVYVSALDAEAERRGISVRGALEKAKTALNNRGQLAYRLTVPGGPRMVRYTGGPINAI